MKQTKLWLTAIAALLCSLTASADIDYDFMSNGICYNITSETTVSVTYNDVYYTYDALDTEYYNYYTKYSGSVVIPSTVTYNNTTYRVTSIGEDAFRDCSSLTSITIPESVTGIGRYAFLGCSSLSAVHIKDIASWCNVGFYAANSNPLYYAKNLYLNGELVTELTIPNTVTAIKYGAFYNYSNLTSITIPESVTGIGSVAFYGCSNLTSITIPENSQLTGIGSDAFYGTAWYNNQPDGVVYVGKVLYKYKGTMPANTSIEIKEGTVSINHTAFYKCSNLTSITIPESVTGIGSDAFYGCSNLTSITIPENSQLTGIGSDAFYGTAWYNNQPDGVVYVGKVLYKYKGTMPANTSIEIKEGTVSINHGAFYNYRNLTSITIPEGVTSIGESAFSTCN